MAPFLSFQNQTTSEIKAFLSQNIIGTPTKSLVYQQLRTEDKLEWIPDPTFLCLKKNQTLLATCCFCHRPLESFSAQYIRYFSFQKKFRSGTISLYRKDKKSAIKTEIHKALSEKGAFASETKPTVFYAYVDPKNERSWRLCMEFGFEKIRTFSTLTFSRMNPKSRKNVSLISVDEKKEMKGLLKEAYSDFQFYTEENLFFDEAYFVMKNEEGTIIAGAQGTKERWEIFSLAGKFGKAAIRIISKLPFLKLIINQDHQFVAFDYLYCKKGHESVLTELLEAILAHHGVRSGLLALDNQSVLFDIINKIKLGPLNDLKSPVNAYVIAKCINDSEGTFSELKSSPAFISTLDLT